MRGRQCSSRIDSSSNITDDDGLLSMLLTLFKSEVTNCNGNVTVGTLCYIKILWNVE